VSDRKQDIEDVKWALKTFAPEEWKRNAEMLMLTRGDGRCVDTTKSFERILKRLEELEGTKK